VRVAAAALCLTLLASCTTSMVTSRPVDSIGPGNDTGIVAYSLPKTLVKLTVRDEAGVRPTEVVVASQPAPDPVHTYVLDYKPNAFSDDTLTIDLAPGSPFISSINGESVDRITETLQAAAESAARIGVLQFSAVPGQARQLSFSFDPHDPAQLDAVRAELARRVGLDIDCRPACPPPTPRAAAAADGVYARGTIPVQLAICEGSCSAATAPGRIVTVASYNASPLIQLPVRRTAFSDRTTQLTFDQGTVSSVHHVKPSEALEVVKVPGLVVGSVFTGLGSAVSNRSGVLTARTQELEQQTALTNALTARLNKQREYITRRQALPADHGEDDLGDPLGAFDDILDGAGGEFGDPP
jgi:hypothetical protein